MTGVVLLSTAIAAIDASALGGLSKTGPCVGSHDSSNCMIAELYDRAVQTVRGRAGREAS
jgi:hypothetical protein